MTTEIHTYEDLQREVHDALRAQHPEWLQPDGECPLCDSYEARLAELLHLFGDGSTPSETVSSQIAG